MKLTDISVVVPTKNESRNIRRFIFSLPADITLIMVDASSDETPQIVSRIRPNQTKIISSQARIAEARNLGGVVAKTKWLLFTDADVEFPSDYFSRLADLPPVPALYGPKRALDSFDRYYRAFSRWQAIFNRIGIPAVSGSNILVQKSVFMELNGFDTRLFVNEDTEFGYRIKRAGYPIRFEPALRVMAFDHRRLKKGFLRKDLHTLLRCTLIYLDIFPKLWRDKDWGYWS